MCPPQEVVVKLKQQLYGKILAEGSFNKLFSGKLCYTMNLNGHEYPFEIPVALRMEVVAESSKLDSVYKLISDARFGGNVTVFQPLQAEPILASKPRHRVRYEVLERSPIGNLFQYLDIAPVNNDKILRDICFQLLTRLDYYHRVLKLAHRDIKPENILIGGNGLLQILDYDFACARDDAEQKIAGTDCYLPPELLLSMPADYDYAAHDAWSVGMTILMCVQVLKCDPAKPVEINYQKLAGSYVKHKSPISLRDLSLQNYDAALEECQILRLCDPELRQLILCLLQKDWKLRIRHLQQARRLTIFNECQRTNSLSANNIFPDVTTSFYGLPFINFHWQIERKLKKIHAIKTEKKIIKARWLQINDEEEKKKMAFTMNRMSLELANVKYGYLCLLVKYMAKVLEKDTSQEWIPRNVHIADNTGHTKAPFLQFVDDFLCYLVSTTLYDRQITSRFTIARADLHYQRYHFANEYNHTIQIINDSPTSPLRMKMTVSPQVQQEMTNDIVRSSQLERFETMAKAYAATDARVEPSLAHSCSDLPESVESKRSVPLRPSR